jgi:hypothetical protein
VRRTVEEEYLSCQVRGKGGEKMAIDRTGSALCPLADRIHPQKMMEAAELIKPAERDSRDGGNASCRVVCCVRL